MQPKPTLQTNNLLQVIFRPQFLIFSLSVIFSQVAVNMLNIVLIVLTYKLTHSSFAVSILIMTFLLPQVLFSFLGGIIADAKNKRKILLFGNIARALILVIFFFVKDTLVFVYVFGLAIALVTQFYVPAETPIIPYLVKKGQILSANAIFGVCLFGSILVGYVAAGPATRLFGISGVFLFMASLFVLAFLCILAMPKIVTKTEKLRTEKTLFGNMLRLYRLVGTEFKICIEIIRKKPEVLSSFIFLALSQVIILVLATIIPDYTQKTLGVSAEDISLVIFAPAALGMILSSILIGGKLAKIKKEKIINVGIFLSVVILLLFASIDLQRYFSVLYITVIVAFTAGIANACIFIPTQTIVQISVEDKYLSKIYGLLFAVIGIMAFLPIILAGVFADVLGVRAVLIGIALFLLSIGFLKIFFGRKKHL